MCSEILHEIRVKESNEYLNQQNKIEIPKHEHNLKNKIILGDSQLYDLEIDGFSNCCIKGDNIINATYRLKRYLAIQKIDEIIICLGTNDIDQLYSIEEIIHNYENLIDLIDDIKITLMPIFNINKSFDNEFMRSRENSFINELNSNLKNRYGNLMLDVKDKFNNHDILDIYYTYDGLHLNDKAINVLKPILLDKE